MGKRVSFFDVADCPVSAIIPVSRYYYEDEDRWISFKDFREIRRNAKEIAKQAHGSSMSRLLEEAFCISKTTTKSSSHSSQLSNDINPSMDPLILWCRHVRMRRGLEEWTCPEHANDRRTKRKILIKTVVSTQNQLWPSSSQKEEQLESIEEQLAKISVVYSKEAIDFARRLGHADEAAAMLEYRKVGSRFSLTSPHPLVLQQRNGRENVFVRRERSV